MTIPVIADEGIASSVPDCRCDVLVTCGDLAHEQMHGTGLMDVNKTSNLMHYTSDESEPGNLALRFEEQVRVNTGTSVPIPPGTLMDNQWEKPRR